MIMEETVKIFKALADPNRIRILKMLEQRSLCVCELTEALQLAVSTVSKHLSVLRYAGFINSTKNGKWVYYSLNRNGESLIKNQITAFLPVWFNEEEPVQRDRELLGKLDRNQICNIKL